MKLKKAKSFEDYFTDEKLTTEQKDRYQLLREITHELYPDVVEKVAYAMPGFYPTEASKATEMLYLVMASKQWLTFGGARGLPDEILADFAKIGVAHGAGSLKIPYTLPENQFRDVLKTVMIHNLTRFHFAIPDTLR
jgi:uncharacterized protein YdhG (YjbR/CyaY superfamily)